MKVSCSTRAMADLAIQIVHQSGRQTAQAIADRNQAAEGTHIPIQLLVRDRTAR
jgi:hypothetical protein